MARMISVVSSKPGGDEADLQPLRDQGIGRHRVAVFEQHGLAEQRLGINADGAGGFGPRPSRRGKIGGVVDAFAIHTWPA
jgi:hypothetical protein